MAAATYWAPVFAWLREDDTIAGWLTDAEKDVLSDAQAEDLPIWQAFFQYQGFDIKRIIRNMIRRGNTYVQNTTLDTIEKTFTIGGQEKIFLYTNHETLAKDVEMIIFLFAERGNAVQKINAKSIGEVGRLMNWLEQKYELDTTQHASGTSLDPDMVTISRVVSCFPIKICEYFHRGFGKALFSFIDLHIVPPAALSRSILCPHIVAMLPREYVETELSAHYVFFYGHCLVDRVIHRKTRAFSGLKEIFTYYSAEFRTPITSQVSRKNFVTSVAIAAAQGHTPIACIVNAVAACRDSIRRDYANDPDLETVIASLNTLYA